MRLHRCPDVPAEGLILCHVREPVFYVRAPRSHRGAPWETVRGNSKSRCVLETSFWGEWWDLRGCWTLITDTERPPVGTLARKTEEDRNTGQEGEGRPEGQGSPGMTIERNEVFDVIIEQDFFQQSILLGLVSIHIAQRSRFITLVHSFRFFMCT